MTDFPYPSLAHEHFDYVKSDVYRRVTQQPKVIKRRLSEQAPLAKIDSASGPNPLVARTCLHFHENQHFSITKDEIGLAARPEVSSQEFQSQPSQMSASNTFAYFPEPQMLRAFAVFAKAAKPFRDIKHGSLRWWACSRRVLEEFHLDRLER